MGTCKHNVAGDYSRNDFQSRALKKSAQFCLFLLKGYRYLISPLFPPSCRYTPSCSQYAVDAVIKYGAWRGLLLSLRRLLRCHPFAKGGYDPVE